MTNAYYRGQNHQWVEHYVESQLIEVMKIKMQIIQYVSIVNLIQMKWMKVINNMKNMMNQECQYHVEYELSMIVKNCESICDN
jgi:hypothetical protein